VTAAGLVVSTDVPLVRTFSARRWVEGLAERLGPLRAPLDTVAGRLSPHAALSLSLGDERVVLAHHVPVERPAEPLVRDRGGPASVHVVLPAYRATRTIPDVVEEMPVDAADRALLIDDCSGDRTADVALEHGLEVMRHPANRGYGAGQKTGYTRALLDGADVVVMVHGDNQYDPGLLGEMVEPILAGRADMVIGSRLLQDRAIAGGMPRWKWLGNRLLTGIENRAFGVRFSEYHTGYRAFSRQVLETLPLEENSDDFVFDSQMLAQCIYFGFRIGEVSCPTRYEPDSSSINFKRSVTYGFGVLGTTALFRACKLGLRHRLFDGAGQRLPRPHISSIRERKNGNG